MNKLQKDDPVYYKVKIKELIVQALNNGIDVYSSFPTHEELVFKDKNGDIASINLINIKYKQKENNKDLKKKNENDKFETWLEKL